MKLRTLAFLLATHSSVAALGFAAGIYVLPLLIAPPAPSAASINAVAAQAVPASIVCISADSAVQGDGVIHECDGVLGNWLAGLGQRIAVVRPDHYVFGMAANAEQAIDLLARLGNALRGQVDLASTVAPSVTPA